MWTILVPLFIIPSELPCHLLSLLINLVPLIYFSSVDKTLVVKSYLKYCYFQLREDQKYKFPTARFILNFAKFFELTLNENLLSLKQTLLYFTLLLALAFEDLRQCLEWFTDTTSVSEWCLRHQDILL